MNPPVAKASQLIRCTPAEAFIVFTDPTKITKFWLASASGPLSENAKVEWEFMVPGATEITTVTEFLPDRLIAFTWSDGTQVALEFTAHSGGAEQ